MKVYIQLYKDMPMVFSLGSKHAQDVLTHKNIVVSACGYL